ncbi:hypothetical protein PR048_027283 [Dryococelus australis]|uniref:Uncharacterized protein n=1 Tax=Dryococelus australis TaxID=614101 RepID=A0ABQ9GF12_9NEOP|nr:hypothetical protein PR048_027283 [Dryococelus australis]
MWSDFRMWGSCRTMPLAGGFFWGSPVSLALAFLCCSILTSLYQHRLSRPRWAGAGGVDHGDVSGSVATPTPPPKPCSSGGGGGLVVTDVDRAWVARRLASPSSSLTLFSPHTSNPLFHNDARIYFARCLYAFDCRCSGVGCIIHWEMSSGVILHSNHWARPLARTLSPASDRGHDALISATVRQGPAFFHIRPTAREGQENGCARSLLTDLQDGAASGIKIEWLDYSPPTTANRVRFPGGSPLDFSMWDSCRTILLVLRDLPVFLALAFRHCSMTHRRLSRPRPVNLLACRQSNQQGNFPQHAVANQTHGPFPRASRRQSAKGYAHIKVNHHAILPLRTYLLRGETICFLPSSRTPAKTRNKTHMDVQSLFGYNMTSQERDSALIPPLIDDWSIMNAVNYGVASSVVWTSRKMNDYKRMEEKRFGRVLTARSREPMRVIEVRMELFRNEGVGWGKREIPEKTPRPAASSGTIPMWSGSGPAENRARLLDCCSSVQPVLPQTTEHGIHCLFPCRSVIGSEFSWACLINCDPISNTQRPAKFTSFRGYRLNSKMACARVPSVIGREPVRFIPRTLSINDNGSVVEQPISSKTVTKRNDTVYRLFTVKDELSTARLHTPVQCFARGDDERDEAQVSIAPSAPTLLDLRPAKSALLLGEHLHLCTTFVVDPNNNNAGRITALGARRCPGLHPRKSPTKVGENWQRTKARKEGENWQRTKARKEGENWQRTKARKKEIWATLNNEVLRADEIKMREERNANVGETGDPRENPADQRRRPARFPLATRPGIGARFALVGGEQDNRSATAAPTTNMLEKISQIFSVG